MIAAILLCVSIVALGQFGFFYWHAVVISISELPVSDRLRVAARIAATAAGARDFRAILTVYQMAPRLRGSGVNFWAIRAYYAALETLGRRIPPIANWAEGEMTTCSRYAAVLVDRHLERNLAWAAQMRGM